MSKISIIKSEKRNDVTGISALLQNQGNEIGNFQPEYRTFFKINLANSEYIHILFAKTCTHSVQIINPCISRELIGGRETVRPSSSDTIADDVKAI